MAGAVDAMSDVGFVPKLVRSLSLPRPIRPGLPFGAGETLTAGAKYLLVAAGSGAVVIDVQAAEAGSSGAVLGVLSSPLGNGSNAVEVTASPDGRYAFVSLDYGDTVAVFDLQAAITSGFKQSGFVGTIPLGSTVVGLALSPDGRWLYATSEIASADTATGRTPRFGTLSVIDVLRAESDPRSSVVATVPAGCEPVRVVLSPDGSIAWVTARGSNALLGFSTSALRSNPSHDLVADVQVGSAPVGLALVKGGQLIVVADSNRFYSGASADLELVDVDAALHGRPAIVGVVRSGSFPREMALEPNGRTLLVTNYDSNQLEAVDVSETP
jgi:DNA-binding beta-propeller fold protein YncE